MMACTNCGDKNVLVWPDGSTREPSPNDKIAQSYGLCLSIDEFVEDKCMWIVDLACGTKVFQDDDRPGLATPSAWKRLGYFYEDHPELARIVKMRLRFGSNIVELPANRPYYFYSRGLLQAITQSHGLDFHIVGWVTEDRADILEIMWFKAPELTLADRKSRLLKDCEKEQLIGIDNRP